MPHSPSTHSASISNYQSSNIAADIHSAPNTTQYGFSLPSHPDDPVASDDVGPNTTVSRKKTHILDLPPEVLLQAISNLDPRDIATSERVCKAWFAACRDDSCWRIAFFARFDAATAPGRRLTGLKSTWKAEYLFRSKLLRMWAKSSAKSRVADLKVSHITNLELLPHGGAFVGSTWTGRGQTLSPTTLKANKLTFLPSDNLVNEVVTIVSNSEYVFWATHLRIECTNFNFKNTVFSLHGVGGPFAALATVQGSDQHSLLAIAFLNGRLAIHDVVTSTKIWETSDQERLMRQNDQFPLTVKALVANENYIVAATEHSLHVFQHALSDTSSSSWSVQLEGRLNYVALDGENVLVHEHGEPVITRWSQGRRMKTYDSINSQQPITAITYDFKFPSSKTGYVEKDFGQQKYVAAGRADGTVDIWMWDADANSSLSVQPVRTLLPAFKQDEMRVTALACSDILLFAGYLDGSIRAFDLLSSQLVRVFNEQSTPKHALRQVLQGLADDRRWMVSRIVANDRTVYASLGERFWTWTCTEAVATKKKKRRGPRLSSRAERYQDGVDIEDSLLDYEAETATRPSTNRRSQFSLESLLSPEEAIQYAQLLSVEAEEERRARLAEQSVEMEFDLEELMALDEMEASGANTPASPVISEHDYEDYWTNQTSYTLGTSATSPRAIGAHSSPYLSPQLRPHGSNSFSHLSDAALSSSLGDQSHFPSLATSPTARQHSQSHSPTPSTPASRGGWSSLLRSSTSPASSSVVASRGSPLPVRSSPSTSAPHADEIDDPDLKLAIQLSLLETRGGGERNNGGSEEGLPVLF